MDCEFAIAIFLSILLVAEPEVSFYEFGVRTVALKAVLAQDWPDVFVEVDLFRSSHGFLSGRKNHSCGKQGQ